MSEDIKEEIGKPIPTLRRHPLPALPAPFPRHCTLLSRPRSLAHSLPRLTLSPLATEPRTDAHLTRAARKKRERSQRARRGEGGNAPGSASASLKRKGKEEELSSLCFQVRHDKGGAAPEAGSAALQNAFLKGF